MSRKVHAEIELLASAEACWRIFGRVEDWPRWFPVMERVERSGSGPITIGEELVLHLAFRGRGAPVRVRVSEVGPRHVRWSGRSFGVTGDHRYSVEPLGDARCRFSSDETFSGLPVRLIPRFVFAELEREHEAGMERFRRLVET
jgi:hypothetical protein